MTPNNAINTDKQLRGFFNGSLHSTIKNSATLFPGYGGRYTLQG